VSEPYEITSEVYQFLGYDLQAAVDKYTADLAAHALTEGVAAPAVPTTVEAIVKSHGGLWVIVAPPTEAAPKQPLPKDPKFYRSAEEQKAIVAALAKEEAIVRAQAKKEARMKELAESE